MKGEGCARRGMGGRGRVERGSVERGGKGEGRGAKGGHGGPPLRNGGSCAGFGLIHQEGWRNHSVGTGLRACPPTATKGERNGAPLRTAGAPGNP